MLKKILHSFLFLTLSLSLVLPISVKAEENSGTIDELFIMESDENSRSKPTPDAENKESKTEQPEDLTPSIVFTSQTEEEPEFPILWEKVTDEDGSKWRYQSRDGLFHPGWIQVDISKENNSVSTWIYFDEFGYETTLKTSNLIQAHRGWGTQPENSLLSIEETLKNGIVSVHIDVRFTKDDIPVLLHDKTINRVATNLDGSKIKGNLDINDLTIDNLDNYNFNITRNDEVLEVENKITKLEEALKFISENKMTANIELKEGSPEQIKQILELTKKYNLNRSVIYSSFNIIILKEVVSLDKFANIKINMDSALENPDEVYKELSTGVNKIQIPYSKYSSTHKFTLMDLPETELKPDSNLSENIKNISTIIEGPPKETFTVTFKDGADKKEVDVEDGSRVEEPVKLIKENYIFAGWYLNGEIFDFKHPITEDIELEAEWKKEKVKVIFEDGFNGEFFESIELEIKNGDSVKPPKIKKPEGYTFIKWSSNSFENITEDRTFTASWTQDIKTEVQLVKLVFKDGKNGEIFEDIIIEGERGTQFDIPMPKDTENYKFISWNPMVSSYIFEEDKVYEAKWSEIIKTPEPSPLINSREFTSTSPTPSPTPETLTVRWELVDGYIIKTETVEFGAAASPPSHPSRQGYVFTGWDSDYSSITESKTIKAMWTSEDEAKRVKIPNTNDKSNILLWSFMELISLMLFAWSFRILKKYS